MKKVILTCFAGRKQYMEIQIKYILELLKKYDFIERYDIWDFSWSTEDSEYLKTLTELNPKIRVNYSPDYGFATRASEVASKQFAYFFTEAYDYETYKDFVFVKIDDDVVYIDTNNFEDFIDIRINNQKHFLISANVVNNQLGDLNPTNIHNHFLNTFNLERKFVKDNVSEFHNSGRLSINFCSWLGKDIPLINEEFSNGIGSNDEWRLCNIIPNKIGQHNLIVEDYLITHFSFGSQSFDKETIYEKYLNLCNTII